VHNPLPPANLALIGFMGTGKTSVGRLVADLLHFDFLDTDELIQARTGRTPQIGRGRGKVNPAFFRKNSR
jgi:shikimate kinase